MDQNIDSFVLTKFNPRTWERIDKIKYVLTEPKEIPELMYKLREDVRNIREELAEYINSPVWNYPIFFYDEDEEYTIQYREYLEKSPDADTSEDKRECDVLICEDSSTFDVCEDHSEILSDSNNDDISSDEDAFEDIEYVEASPFDLEIVSLEEENVEEEEFNLEDIFQIQDVVLREKLLSINRLIANIESLNDNPTPDHMLNYSTL
nr:hypothetical protein [Tanacetum cinerariifolium]